MKSEFSCMSMPLLLSFLLSHFFLSVFSTNTMRRHQMLPFGNLTIVYSTCFYYFVPTLMLAMKCQLSHPMHFFCYFHCGLVSNMSFSNSQYTPILVEKLALHYNLTTHILSFFISNTIPLKKTIIF